MNWLPIPGWEGSYEVSDVGLVRSVPRTIIFADGRVRPYPGQILRPGVGEHGHRFVNLYRHGKAHVTYVHVAMMAAFVGPRPFGMLVCHGDGNAANNVLPNLRYDTSRENTLDNVRNGTHHYSRRDACKWEHLLSGPNLRVARKQRICLACHNARNQLSKARTQGRPVPDFKIVVAACYAKIMGGDDQ